MRRWDGWLSWISATILAATTATSSGPAGDELDPPPTVSRYIVSTGAAEPADAQGYRTGCTDGKDGGSGLRVLFFGTQQADGQVRPPGTTSSSPVARVSEDWVAQNAAGWVRGFVECGQATAVVALGVNNKSDGDADPAEAGVAWAALVERVAATAPADRVVVTGALDGEPSWSKADWARGWVDAYIRNTPRPLYAANSADGCPADGPGEACSNGWTVADVFHVSTGAATTVIALPQIYRTDGIQARQWAAISRWGVRSGAGPLRIAGVLTQRKACEQKSGCPRTANSPDEAHEQLTKALGEDPATMPPRPLVTTDVAWPTDAPAP